MSIEPITAVAVVGVGRHPPRRPGRGELLGQRPRRPLLDHRRVAGPLGPGPLLRRQPEGAGQDLLQDRRLGARLDVGPAGVEAADPATRRRGDGRRPEVGGRLHPGGAARLRLARTTDRRRTHRRRARQRDVRRAPLPHRAAHRLPRARPRARPGADVPGPARRRPQGDQRRVRRADRPPLSGDHRGHDARRAGQLHGRPGRQPVRPPRAQLRRRRRLRVGPRRDRRLRRRARQPRVRRRHRRWRRPQHGRVELRQVLQDRRPLGHRHPALRRRRRRLRDGRGRRRVRAQAARRRRARRRPHLRRAARHRRRQRRAGQGDHRPQPGRPAAGGGAGLAQRRAVPGVVRDDRVPRHVDARRRRRRGDEHRRGVRRRRPRGRDRSRSARRSRTSAT